MVTPLTGPRAGDRILLAIGLLLLSVLCFSILNASAKYLTQWFAASQIVWARYVFSFFFMLIVFMPRHGTRIFKVERPWSQILRGFLLFMSSFLYFRGLAHLPLPTAAAISQSSPIIVTAMAAPLLAEAVGLRRWIAVLVGFGGALIIVRPGMAGFDWHALYIVGSTTCSAFYQLVTRKYGAQERPEASATIATIVGTVAATPFLPFDFVMPTAWWQWAMFVGLGALAGLGHYFLTIAFSRAPAAIIAPFNYTQLLWAAALGFVIFGDLPDLWTWIGAGIIVASGLYIAHREQLRRRKQSGG
ncbi:DMT family transporter [Desertibaculum subflavum]|uniref:DMT family transporter n=1 Tax=Desertibaculum subflavum TaxID=2268458 RepID=UPI000E66C531